MSTHFTADSARQFDSFSTANAATLAGAAHQHGCNCAAYTDWYTYARWQAQGYQVQHGEHGIKISTYAPIIKKDEDGKEIVIGKRPWTSTVFCRCQVKEKS